MDIIIGVIGFLVTIRSRDIRTIAINAVKKLGGKMNRIFYDDRENEPRADIDIYILNDGFIFDNDFEIIYRWKDRETKIHYEDGYFIDDIPYAFMIEPTSKGIGNNDKLEVGISKADGLVRIGNITLLKHRKYEYQDALNDVMEHFFSENGNLFYEHIFYGISAGIYAMADIMKKGRERRKLIKKGSANNHKYSREHRLSTQNRKIWLMDDVIQYVSDNYIEHKSSRIIECPCWEVRGHYRHYKSGRVVFIPSYRKGKQRDKVQPKKKEYYI